GLFEKTQSIGGRYRQKVEEYKEKILTMPEYKDPITKRGIKVVAGAAQLPAGVVELVGATAMGLEIAAREPVESVKALPSVAGLIGGGLVHSVKVKPYETAGEFAAFAVVGGVRPKVPTIKGGKLVLEPLDLTGRLRTIGGEYIPPEKLFAPDVYTGKTQFPMTKKGDTISDILGEFATEKRVIRDEMLSGEAAGFHATGVQIGTDVRVLNPKSWEIGRGTDVGGLYISPTGAGASKHFLRTGIEQRTRTLFGFGSDPTTPTLLKIGLEGGVKRLPKEIRTDVMGAREFLQSGAVEGRGYLTPVLESTVRKGGVAEFEAVIAPKTLLTQLKGRRQYTIVDG
ncbi:MAG: hypothetical protein KAJ03_03650, partial [Gammaproteobacteria bacterium]|nr:hypothetical protein [Gammaproteobacteria bacterium]